MIAVRPRLIAFACVPILLLALWLSWLGLDRLQLRRAALDAAERANAVTLLPVGGLVPGGGYRASMREVSAESFRLRLLEAAVDRRLLVERIDIAPPVEGATARIAARVVVSGPEADVLAFVGAVERGRPLARFTAWRISHVATGDAAVRLDGTATSLWEGI